MDQIRCDEPNYLIWKWHPTGSQGGDTKRETAIRWGSSLRVREGSAAAFVYTDKDGSPQDFIEGPFDEILKTSNLPVIASIIGTAYDGGTPFQAEVYFINLAQVIQVKFAVPFFDVYDPRFLDFGVPTAARGTITFKITDYHEFIKLHRLDGFTLDDFRKQVRDAITRYVKDAIANAPSAYNVPLIQLERKITDINDAITPKITERLLEKFGVTVTGVDLAAIEFDKSSAGYKSLMCGVTRESALFSQFRAHYGCRSTYCNPYSGNEKGSVENAVGFPGRNLMASVPKTTFDRFFGSPEVRFSLGIKENGDRGYYYDGTMDSSIGYALGEIANKGERAINSKAQRLTLLNDSLNHQDEVEQIQGTLDGAGSFDTIVTDNGTDNGTDSSGTARSYPTGRSTVAPRSGCPLNTAGEPNIANIYRELKGIKADDYPMAWHILAASATRSVRRTSAHPASGRFASSAGGSRAESRASSVRPSAAPRRRREPSSTPSASAWVIRTRRFRVPRCFQRGVDQIWHVSSAQSQVVRSVRRSSSAPRATTALPPAPSAV